ncbi:MAG: GNAT family N-acetyltransferase [Chloroflexota bacterium]
MDIQSVTTQLRQMTLEDGVRGAALVKKIGWSQTAAIWEQTIGWSGDGSFCLATDDELLATIIVMSYGTDLAWIGMVVTHPDYQRQGLARQIMEVGLEYAQERGIGTVMLDASQMGYPLYFKLGFQSLYKIEVFEGTGITSGNNNATRALTETDIPGIIEIDTRLFGVARPEMIRDLAVSGQSWVLGEPGNIQGYLMTKPGSQSISIGPWYHQNPEGAEILLESLIAATPGSVLKAHIPEANTAAKAIVISHGLQFNRFVTRMVLGGETPGQMEQQYSVAALATG